MDNLNRFVPLLVLVDGGFMAGFLKSLGAPLTPEGWGVALGSLTFVIASQWLQGKLNTRRWRTLRQQLVAEFVAHLEAARQSAKDVATS